jgi:hypothetical protein
MYDARRRMASDPFDRKFSQLVDARSVTSVEMNGYTVKKFAEGTSLHRRRDGPSCCRSLHM